MDKILEKLEKMRSLGKASELISTPSLDTGILDPQRENAFRRMVRNNSGFLSTIRQMAKNQATNSFDKILLGEPITEPAEELESSTRRAKPVFQKVYFTGRKLRTQYGISWESLRENLEGRRFGSTLASIIAEKVADDIELLAIQGNTDIPITQTDPTSTLLRANDGFDKITDDQSRKLDAGGSTIVTKLFVEAYKKMPARFKKNPARLRWFCHPNVKLDYLKVLQGRSTNLGDLYTLQNRPMTVLGIPLVSVPYIPADKSVTVVTATPAYIKSTRCEPFRFQLGVNSVIVLNVDGAGNTTINLPEGGATTLEVAQAINRQIGFNLAEDDGYGFLVLKSPTLGASSSIQVVDVANNAYQTLGLEVGTVTGANAPSGSATNSVNEGTFIWLCDPLNFAYVQIDGNTRMYTRYDQYTDSFDTTMYQMNDFVIEEPEAIVKIINIKMNNEY